VSETSIVMFKQQWVHFRIRDVYYPEAERLLRQLHGDDLLQGRVVDVSDTGATSNAFAVIEVEGLEQPVVVPTNRIMGVL